MKAIRLRNWLGVTLVLMVAVGLASVASTVVINEVAWAGTAADPSDEWIELHNPGDVAVNLAGWAITFGDKVIHLGVAEDNTREVRRSIIDAGGYLLLERTDDQTISDVTADVLYTGTLPNGGIAIELRDDGGQVVDRIDLAGEAWPAGTSSGGVPPYGSMERTESAGWATNDGRVRNGLDADGGLVNGTPGRPNAADQIALVVPQVELLWSVGDDEEVQGIAILAWTATDPDGIPEALRISIDLSVDGGETWETLASGLANGGSFAWDTSLHEDSESAVLRILAEDADGHWGRAESAPFTIRNASA